MRAAEQGNLCNFSYWFRVLLLIEAVCSFARNLQRTVLPITELTVWIQSLSQERMEAGAVVILERRKKLCETRLCNNTVIGAWIYSGAFDLERDRRLKGVAIIEALQAVKAGERTWYCFYVIVRARATIFFRVVQNNGDESLCTLQGCLSFSRERACKNG